MQTALPLTLSLVHRERGRLNRAQFRRPFSHVGEGQDEG